MLPANLGSVQEPTVVEVLPTVHLGHQQQHDQNQDGEVEIWSKVYWGHNTCVTLSSTSYIAIADEIFKVCVT